MTTHNYRILYFCPDYDGISGGIKQIYRHVDILNKNNIKAYVVHNSKEFELNWFDHQTKILYRKSDTNSLKINSNDIFVWPECRGTGFFDSYPDNVKIIFNQNIYYTFLPFINKSTIIKKPFLHKDIIATMVVSEHSKKYLASIYPHHKIYRTYCGIDENIFYLGPHKEDIICYMPRKLKKHTDYVIGHLAAKGVLEKYKLVSIENMREAEVANIMRKAKIFLSFGDIEGFGLPSAEAMACGCIVIGYHGGGGEEFFHPKHCFPVTNADPVKYAEIVEDVIKKIESCDDAILNMGKIASKFVLEHYSTNEEEKSVIAFWEEIIKRCK